MMSFLFLVAYWLVFGFVFFIMVLNSPNRDKNLPDLNTNPSKYLALSFAIGGIAVPAILIVVILEAFLSLAKSK